MELRSAMAFSAICHWIGLRENLNRKPSIFQLNKGFSCKFSLKPIHWICWPQVSGIFTAHPTPDLRVRVESGSPRKGLPKGWPLEVLAAEAEAIYGTTIWRWSYYEPFMKKMRLLKIFEDVLNCVVLSLMIFDWLLWWLSFFETMLMEELWSRTCGWISSWTNTESRQIQHNPPNLPSIQDQTQDVQWACSQLQVVPSGNLT